MISTKTMLSTFFLILSIFLLSSFSNASSWIVANSTDFNEGVYDKTLYNASFVQLSSVNYSGNYYSKIFDAGNSSSWNSISWVEGCPYGEPLLDYQGTEEGAVYCGIDMVGNRLLMHLDDSGDSVVDTSGSGYNGTSIATIFQQSGIIGYSVLFDNTSAKILLGVPLMTGTGDFTIGIWVKRATATAGVMMGNFDTPNINGIYLDVTAAGQVRTGLASLMVSSVGRINSLGRWYHVVVRRLSGNVTIFLDGKQDNSGIMAGVITGNLNFTIGNIAGTSSGYAFTGNLDEVFVMNRSMTDQEIHDIFQRGAANLQTSVRSCDDSNCIGEVWYATFSRTPSSLFLPSNRFFQFKSIFDNTVLNENISVVKLYNVTVDYDVVPSPTPIPSVVPTSTPIGGYQWVRVVPTVQQEDPNVNTGLFTIGSIGVDMYVFMIGFILLVAGFVHATRK